VIVELDGPEPTSDAGPRDWLLPALLAVGCAVVLVVASYGHRPAKLSEHRGGTVTILEPEPLPGRALDPMPPHVWLPSLGFPPDVARMISRSDFRGAGAYVSAAELDEGAIRRVYELPDGRRLVLLQVPVSLALQPVDHLAVQGPAQIRATAGTSARGPWYSVIWWAEAGSLYRISSTQIDVAELILFANALR
jgi:hypothetical protein